MENQETMNGYTIVQWEEDMRLNKFCGKHPNWFYSGCTIPCPNCHSIGFYGPKVTTNNVGEIIRRYRACKFCGFWQETDGTKPYRCIALYCGTCGSYDWTAPKEEEDYKNCPKCKSKYTKIEWASDNPNHAFHNLKKQMDQLHGLSGISS